MERSMFTNTELQLASEQNAKYQGTAKISLNQITLHPSLVREFDARKVHRLCKIFKKDGCRRLDIQHHVTATVSRRHLDAALSKARVSAQELMTNPPDQYPHLQFSAEEVRCLHGQHRLKAGGELLSPSDQWWTVDLYLDDISSGLQTSLIDEYSNARPPSDGEVYRKVRQYQHEANSRFEERWISRLSANKVKRLRQLNSHTHVRAAFDAMLAIPGLWGGLHIGSFARVLALNCDEEIVNYLTFVKEFWASLVGNDRERMIRIDLQTVESLQLLAPGVSRKDVKTARGRVLSGEAFGDFSDSERRAIWENLQGRKEIIPSLHTFFQDIYYLEACANCLKRLVAVSKFYPTLRRAFGSILQTDPEAVDYMIQTSETGQRRSGSLTDREELSYRQLWLYAMRHYRKMPKEPGSDDLLAKSSHEKADEGALYEMAAFAQSLGFSSDEIKALIKLSPDRQVARAVLLKARDPERFQYDSGIFESLVNRIVACFSYAAPIECRSSPDSSSGSETPLRARCGLPHSKAQKHDRQFLFVDQVHTEDMPAGEKVSTLFVRRCVYFAFFGKPRHQARVGGSPPGGTTSTLPMSPLFVPEVGPLVESRPTAERALPSGGVEESESKRLRRAARRERRRRKEEKERRRQERRRHTTTEIGLTGGETSDNIKEPLEYPPPLEEINHFGTSAPDSMQLVEEELLQPQHDAGEAKKPGDQQTEEDEIMAENTETERLRWEAEEHEIDGSSAQEQLMMDAEELAADETGHQVETVAAEELRLSQKEAEKEQTRQEAEERAAAERAAEDLRLQKEASEAAEPRTWQAAASAAEEAGDTVKTAESRHAAGETRPPHRVEETTRFDKDAEAEQQRREEEGEAPNPVSETATLTRPVGDAESVKKRTPRPTTQFDLAPLIFSAEDGSSYTSRQRVSTAHAQP
ncbi:hypothetical protein LOZ65_006832, partial [Ophidiomyces ophidiicola]